MGRSSICGWSTNSTRWRLYWCSLSAEASSIEYPWQASSSAGSREGSPERPEGPDSPGISPGTSPGKPDNLRSTSGLGLRGRRGVRLCFWWIRQLSRRTLTLLQLVQGVPTWSASQRTLRRWQTVHAALAVMVSSALLMMIRGMDQSQLTRSLGPRHPGLHFPSTPL